LPRREPRLASLALELACLFAARFRSVAFASYPEVILVLFLKAGDGMPQSAFVYKIDFPTPHPLRTQSLFEKWSVVSGQKSPLTKNMQPSALLYFRLPTSDF
jgi:hypothetical protein